MTGNIVSTLAQSPSRVLDLAVSPNGLELVAVGRGEVGIVPPPPTRSGSRNDAPVVTSLVMPLHEKRISVFNIADKKLKLSVFFLLYNETDPLRLSVNSDYMVN